MDRSRAAPRRRSPGFPRALARDLHAAQWQSPGLARLPAMREASSACRRVPRFAPNLFLPRAAPNREPRRWPPQCDIRSARRRWLKDRAIFALPRSERDPIATGLDPRACSNYRKRRAAPTIAPRAGTSSRKAHKLQARPQGDARRAARTNASLPGIAPRARPIPPTRRDSPH